MENFNPVLTDIYQIIPASLLELDLKSDFRGPVDWGRDRDVSLKNRDTKVKKQWNGTCTSFATIAAVENKLGGAIELSERSLWDQYGVYNTEQAIKTASVQFIMEEKYWPEYQENLDPKYKGKGRFQLRTWAFLGSDHIKVLESIDKGHPCIVGMSTPRDLFRGNPVVESSSGIIRKSGHALCVSGYKVENGNAYFLVKNSWGTTCGDGGYQYVSFDLFDKKRAYALFWTVQEILDLGPSEAKMLSDPLLDDNDDPEFDIINYIRIKGHKR